jgi:hypothetical protein
MNEKQPKIRRKSMKKSIQKMVTVILHGQVSRHRAFALAAVAFLFASGVAFAGDQVPFKGSDLGYFVVSPTGNPTVVLTQDFATGRATHLGKYKLVAQEFINLATLEVTDGSFTITAANGDTIYGTYSGQAAATDKPGVITYDVTGPITGGTGRFEGATGTLNFLGVADLSTGVLSETITGTISSIGSINK